MTQQEQERWDEANEMEQRYPDNPVVIMHAIRIRNEILQQMEKRMSN